jgi:hypothetical protein
MRRFSMICAVLALMLVCVPGLAKADLLYLQGVNYPNVSAMVDFSYLGIDPEHGTISVSLKNTASISSAFTGFAFNAPGNVTGLGTFTGPNVDWTVVYTPNAINTPMQFGFFDLAAITGPNFNGGTPPNGIWNGKTGVFSIGVTGTNMNTLTTSSFLSLFSDLGGNVGVPENFVGRVQAIGLCGDGSDVAIPSNVPIPPSALLMGSGLLGIGLVGWRQKKAKA